MTDSSPTRILYIEDELSLCDLFKMTVEAHGYVVDIAFNGEDGLTMYGKFLYGLVAIDYQLPDITGIDIALKLLVDDQYLAIIMVTGRGSEQVAAEALTLGITSYIIKDNPEVYGILLPNVISSALSRAAVVRENIASWKALREANERLEERVTQRTKQLNLSQARLDNIVALAPEAVIAADDSLFIQLFNKSAQSMFGYDEKEVIGRSIYVLLPDRFRAKYDKYVTRFKRSPKTRMVIGKLSEAFGRRKDGYEFPAQASLSMFDIDGKNVITIMIQDITEHKENEDELHFSLVITKLADKAKGDFLGNMSHGLRIRLNTIIGLTETMQREMMGPLENETYKNYIGMITTFGNHLLSLIGDILDVSKIEAGVKELDEDEVDVAKVIMDSVKMVLHRAQNSGIDLTTDVGTNFSFMRADPVRQKQILLNLLDNAIKFTDAGGKVVVAAGLENDGGMNIQISDTGIGIAAEDMKKILMPFGQVEMSPSGPKAEADWACHW